jgi:hypothetical protein
MRKKILVTMAAIFCAICLMGLTPRDITVPFAIPAVPKGLPSLGEGNWEKVLNMGLNSFFFNTLSYSRAELIGEGPKDIRKSMILVYSLLNPVGHWQGMPEELTCPFRPGYGAECPSANLKKVLFTVANTDKYQQIAYPWMSDGYKKLFWSMDKDQRQVWLEIAEYANQYLKNYNYQEELAYYKKLKTTYTAEDPRDCGFVSLDHVTNGKCNQLSRFSNYKPDGTYHPYRKLDSFIFRRIYNKEISLAQMKKLAGMILADLKATAADADANNR